MKNDDDLTVVLRRLKLHTIFVLALYRPNIHSVSGKGVKLDRRTSGVRAEPRRSGGLTTFQHSSMLNSTQVCCPQAVYTKQ